MTSVCAVANLVANDACSLPTILLSTRDFCVREKQNVAISLDAVLGNDIRAEVLYTLLIYRYYVCRW